MGLTFKFGTMGVGKTTTILTKRDNYKKKDGVVVVVTPSVDVRFGKGVVKARSGLACEADIVLEKDELLEDHIIVNKTYEGQKVLILVDEAQFFSERTIESFRRYADNYGFLIECYGLRTDFTGRLFDGSKRLLELADKVELMETPCCFCENPAVFNLRVDRFNTDQVVLGSDAYREVCSLCYTYEMGEEDN